MPSPKAKTIAVSLLVFTSLCLNQADADWPQFRGPTGQGDVDAEGLPLHWSETENIVWKTPIPGMGWSSPVIAGNQIWMTTATDDGRSLRAICVDRQSGQLVKNVEVFVRSESEQVHSQNSHATPTPVIDGDAVFVHFGRNGTAKLTKDGEVVWRNETLRYETPHGSGGSPVFHDGLLIVSCDGTDRQFVAALSSETGEVVWNRERQHLDEARRKSAEEPDESRRGLPFIAFSTPLVIASDNGGLLISAAADHVVANRVATGEEVWWLPYNCFSLVARPVLGDGLVYAIGGIQDGHYELFAIRLGHEGRLTEKHLAWKSDANIPQIPSPVLVGDLLFLFKRNGVASCLNAATGEELWRVRIGGNYRASPIATNLRVYILNQEGTTTILESAAEYRPLATNQLDGIFLASPAVAGKSLFLRSNTHLYRIETSP